MAAPPIHEYRNFGAMTKVEDFDVKARVEREVEPVTLRTTLPQEDLDRIYAENLDYRQHGAKRRQLLRMSIALAVWGQPYGQYHHRFDGFNIFDPWVDFGQYILMVHPDILSREPNGLWQISSYATDAIASISLGLPSSAPVYP